MQVRPGDTAGGADGADDLAEVNRLPLHDGDLAQMAIHRHETLSVIENHGVAVEKIVAGRRDDAAAWRPNRRSFGSSDVHALVR